MNRFGPVTALVNNAGRNSYADPVTMTDADWDAMLISGDGIPRRQDAYTTQRLQQTFEASRECTPARATP